MTRATLGPAPRGGVEGRGRAADPARPGRREATSTPEARGLARDGVRLLVSTPAGHRHARFRDLPGYLPAGTILVVNDSDTLPASLPAEGPDGPFRLNLSTRFGARLWLAEPRWSASRPGPLPIRPGDRFRTAGLPARAVAPYPGRPRLWFVAFEGDVGAAMRRAGRPIRYGYLEPPYPGLEAYRTAFARVPGSAETPSAARPFTPRVVAALRRAGVEIASVTLHAGVSSLELEGDEEDLPPEPFRVPAATAAAVNRARREGRPVVAVGTTVVRALESAREGEGIVPRSGFTRLFVRPGRGVHAVDGLLTGLHEPRASHLRMLEAIAGAERVGDAYREAEAEGYLWHEFGDSHLILPADVAFESGRAASGASPGEGGFQDRGRPSGRPARPDHPGAGPALRLTI